MSLSAPLQRSKYTETLFIYKITLKSKIINISILVVLPLYDIILRIDLF